MNINISEINYKGKVEINDTFSFDDSFFNSSGIKKLDDVNVSGYIYLDELENYKAKLNVNGTMYIEDSITLEDIPYDFDFEIDDEIDEKLINNQNMLDIMELLWENIVLEKPISYTQSDADNLSGDNWQVISDNDKGEEIDPRMQKLYDYYNKGGE